MFIFDNITWEKVNNEEHLWIDKPCCFYGQQDNPNNADLKRANQVGNYGTLIERLSEVKKARNNSNGKVRLADNNSKLRGYGAGLALIGQFNNAELLYFPQRDAGAPGDRLIWDVCAGRTTYKDESPNYFHRMIMEGLEEITFVINNQLVIPCLDNTLKEMIDSKEVETIVTRNAKILGIESEKNIYIPFNYTPPKNACTIHQILEDGSEIAMKANWGIEAKYSGLELMSYALLDFKQNPDNLQAYDGEEFAPGKMCNREIHEINPKSGKIHVFQKGKIIRQGTVTSEINRRNKLREQHDYSKDRPGLMPIPNYPASIKADMLTKQNAWPLNFDISALEEIQFRD